MLHLRKVALGWISFLVLATSGWAIEPPNPKLAITDFRQVDEDFDFSGEYTGSFEAGMGGTIPAALQVIAEGGGKFRARLLIGGLPAFGWNGFAKVATAGTRAGHAVTLEGKPYSIIIERTGSALVRYVQGTLVIGNLRKIHRSSPTMGAPPPSGAIVLFDGKTTEHLKNAKVTPDGLLMVGAETKEAFRDYTLHVEFRTPYMPYARGQGRGNSGVYLQSRYEVQILDSFGLDGADNECGGLYKYRRPLVNMCYPPLSWQTYDIEFHGPKFDDGGRKTANSVVTVKHNGVVVQNNVELAAPTGGGSPEGPNALPIKFQDHGNPVHFRNIWLVDHNKPPECQWVAYCCRRRCCLFLCCPMP